MLNNKPVAWITEKALGVLEIPVFSQVTNLLAVNPSQVDNFNVPLYTHPAKTLTDEEILVFQDADGNELKVDTTKWKLRKAQEK